MESSLCLFPIPEIEKMILSYLEPVTDYQKLILVNKHFFWIVYVDKTYQELKDFSKKESFLEFDTRTYWTPRLKHHNMLFLKSCRYNYLRVAKYIYHKYEIDIHQYCEDAFRISCKYGHLKIVKWLYNLESPCKINTHFEISKFVYHMRDGKFDIDRIVWYYRDKVFPTTNNVIEFIDSFKVIKIIDSFKNF